MKDGRKEGMEGSKGIIGGGGSGGRRGVGVVVMRTTTNNNNNNNDEHFFHYLPVLLDGCGGPFASSRFFVFA